MSQNPDSRPTPPRFLEVAKELCGDAKFDTSVSTARAAELQEQMKKDYSDGITELGLEPDMAERRALELFHPPSAVKQFKQPAHVRLLFSDRCRPMRYFLMMLGVVGIVASFRSDAFKSGREVDWVQRVTDVSRYVISCIGGLCLLTEILVFLDLRQKARALYRQGSDLVLCILGGRVGQVPVQILFVLLLIGLIGQHGGFLPAGNADRFNAANPSNPASISITERGASEEVRGASSVVKDETPAYERKPSDGMEVAGGTPAGSSVTRVETGAPTSVNEPGADEVFSGGVSYGKQDGLGVEPAASEVAGGITAKSSTLSSVAVEPTGGEIAGGIADSPASAGLVVSKLQPAVRKADDRPAPPTSLRVVLIDS